MYIIFSTAAAQMFKLILLIAAGYFLCRKGILNDTIVNGITALVLNFCVPIMIFNALQMDYSSDLLKNGLIIIILYLTSCVLAFILASALQNKSGLPKNAESDWKFNSLFSNVGFIGLPVVAALFNSSEATFYACCVVVTNNIFFGSCGEQLYKYFHGQQPEKASLKKLASSPLLIAMTLGLICFFLRIRVPDIIAECCDSISATVTPLIMFSIGALLTKGKLSEMFFGYSYYVMVFIKMIISPLAVWAISRLLPCSELTRTVILIMCAMPGPAAAAPLSLSYGNPVWASRYVIISTVVSIVTLPTLYVLVNCL